jgi:tetratricopeptide (TPR) repeat protein
MTNTLFSKNGDKLLLGFAPLGVSVAIIPETPPKADALDVFTLNIRFTNVARIAAMLEQGGAYTSDRDGSQITTVDGEYIIQMPFEHDPGSSFTAVLDHDNSQAFAAFFQDALAGRGCSQDEETTAFTNPVTERVGRNDPCPCGSGKKYKKCCISLEPQQQVMADPRRLPPELRPLAESHDPLCQGYVSAFLQNPDIKRDAEFWHSAGCAISTHGQPYAALACLEIARRLSPSNSIILLNLAATMAACESHDEALAIIDTLPRRLDRRAVIRANILQTLERHEEAIVEYQHAIEEEPEFYLPYARLLNSLKATDSSLYEYWLDRAVDSLPRSPAIAQYFVRYCQEQRRFDDLADAKWLDYLEADTGRVDVFGRGRDEPVVIARCQVLHLAASALRDRSLSDLQRAIEVLRALPEHAELCDAGRFIADVAASLGFAKGVEVGWSRICRHCVEQRIGLPKSGLVAYQIAAHMNCGDNEQAVTLCEQTGGARAEDPMILRSYWWALDDLGRTGEAIPVAEHLAELVETESPLFYNLGYLCGKEGAFGKARYYYQKELEGTPTNLMAWENLAFVHLLASQVEDAERCYREYQRLRNEDLALCTAERECEGDAFWREEPDTDADDEASLIAATRGRFDAKDIKFRQLVLQAQCAIGSMSYAIDLIAENNATTPIVGSFTTVKPVFLTPEQILANLAGGAACTAELQFHVASQQRADASAVLASIEQHCERWRKLPESAQRSLVEAERIFHAGTAVDFSPAIVSYAKAFEICLYELVFKSFKAHSGADFRIEQHVKAVLEDPQSKAIRLARFVEAGHALELGTMTFILQLCTGRSCDRIPLLAALRDHIVTRLGAPGLLDKDYLAGAEVLAARFRNKAAHEKTFDHESCRDAREIVFRMLNAVPV